MKNKQVKIFIAVFLSVILGLTASPGFSGQRKPIAVSAKSAILYDVTRGKSLYSKNIHKRVLPASTTKVMTAILVLEKLSLDKVVTISSRASGAVPSNIGLKPGEKFKVRDLLYAVLLSSANDASIALAEAVAGTEQRFVSLMNQRARQLGAKHTKFANSNGLPTNKIKQYTTAYDMYRIFSQALKYKFFRKAIQLEYKTIYSQGKPKARRKIALKSHNKILFKGWKRKIYGKTGYTRAAGSCFVGTVKKGNRTFIINVFGCTRRWDDIRYIVSKYAGVAL